MQPDHKSGSRIVRRLVVLVAVPLVLGLLNLSVLGYLLYESEEERSTNAHNRKIYGVWTDLEADLLALVSATYTYGFSREDVFVVRYREISAKIDQESAVFADLLKDNPDLTKQFHHVKELSDGVRSDLSRIMSMLGSGQTLEQPADPVLESIVLRKIGAIAKALNQAKSDSSQGESSIWQKRFEAFIGWAAVANIVLSTSLALYFSKSITQRLSTLMENARRLARREPLLATVSGADEIKDLDLAFHSMAVALKEQSHRQKALVENARDVICSIDETGKFKSVSQASAKLWGYMPEELVGRSLAEIAVDSESGVETKLFEQTDETVALSFEDAIVRKDGRPVDMLWSARWSAADKVHFCVAHEITERKFAEKVLRQSQDRLRLIIQSLPVALLVVDADGRIELANQTVRLFAAQSVSPIGHKVETVLPALIPDRQDGIIFLLQKYLNQAGEVGLTNADGRKLSVEILLKEVVLNGQQRYCIVLRDVTQRHEAELLRQEFLNLLANDLGQPLLFVKSGLEAVSINSQNKLNARGTSLLQQAQTEAERLIILVSELLKAERLSSGKLMVELKEHSIADIVQRSIDSVQVLAEQRAVVLANLCNDSSVKCDASLLVQVLVNLLSNALKFAPAHTKVTVSSEESDGEITIKVTDQGRGIPPDKLQTIFEKFVQVQESDQKSGGTGLGLAICKLIVERHQGRIGVVSEEGKGSCFWFSLPKDRYPLE